MTENQPHQPQNQPGENNPAQGSTYGNQPEQGSSPSFGSPERTQQLPVTGYGQHSQQQYAPQGGQPRTGQHPSGGSAYPQGGQFGPTGTHQGTSPAGPNWPFGPQPPAQPEPPKPRRRGLALVAATALLVGTAGGVGGAAVYSATNSNTATPSVTAPLTGGQAAPAAAPDGSVQSAAAKVLPSVVKIGVITPQGAATGSGIVISKDGLIVTNNHVVESASGNTISVMLNDGRTVSATIVGTDPLTDLAVIKASANNLTPAVLGKSGTLGVGQGVVAIGSPFGLEATVTSGIVSALDRPVTSGDAQQSSTTVFPAIQTDAAINPGNSGGALIDLAGQVVGINSAIKTAGGSGQSSGGNIGLGFAIPIDQAKPIIDELAAKGKATHARLGVQVGDAQSSGGLQQGAALGVVTPGGAADKAGLKAGDVVTAVNGKAIASGDALVAAVRSHRPDDEVTVTYTRAGKSQTAKAKLGSDNGKPTG